MLAGAALAAVLVRTVASTAAAVLSGLISVASIAGSVNDLSACGNAQQQKRYEEGIEACTRALNARGINASDQAFTYQRRGRMYFAQRKYDEAIADFSEVIRLKPGFAENYADRANAYSGRGESDRALADLDEAVRPDPANLRVRVQRGYMRAPQTSLRRLLRILKR
jgi:tetratricopeptide (TPR) repeat protein